MEPRNLLKPYFETSVTFEPFGIFMRFSLVKGARRRGRQKKRWEDNIKEWTGMEFGNSLRAAEDRERYCCNAICGAPTTIKFKGLRVGRLPSKSLRDNRHRFQQNIQMLKIKNGT